MKAPSTKGSSSLTEREAAVLLTGGALRRLHVLARVFRVRAWSGEEPMELDDFLDWCDQIDEQHNGVRKERE